MNKFENMPVTTNDSQSPIRPEGLEMVPMNVEETLALLRSHFEGIADRTGMPIEKGIIDTVVVFNSIGYKTRQSCEGHAGKEGLPFSWIDIQNEFVDTEEGQEYEDLNREFDLFLKTNQKEGQKISGSNFPGYSRLMELRKKVINDDEKTKERLVNLLNEFYSKKGSSDFEYGVLPIRGSVRLMPKLVIKMDQAYVDRLNESGNMNEDIKNGKVSPEYDSFDEEKRREWVQKSQNEMQRINEYLKERINKNN